MTPEEEHFQTYTEDGQPSALVARSDVHRLGLLHRSVHIFVWNTADELLVTQRSADKDICPAYWDLSAAEHQKPGETGFESAFRGLREELGIHSVCLRQSLGWSRHRMTYPELGIVDYEETATYSTRYAGELQYADGEVMASRWIARDQIGIFMMHEKTTPWMKRDLKMLNLIG